MNVYLDDIRQAPPGYELVKTAREVIDLLKKGVIENLSLDHDLGFVRSESGFIITSYEASQEDGSWLVKKMCRENLWPKQKPKVHSENYEAAKRMQHWIDRYGPYSK